MIKFIRSISILALAIIFFLACKPKANEQINQSGEMESSAVKSVKRYGSVIKVKPEMLEKYKELHANPWPEVLAQISKSNIRNYSIFLKDDYLFSYFEYVGEDFDADMAIMAQDSVTKEWWKVTDPCQIPLETRAEGEWWASMEEVFHHE